MKTIAYLFQIVLFSSVLFVFGCSPNTQFTLLDGKQYSERDFQGQWLVVNFWAEWCAPCIEEIPALNQLVELEQQLGFKLIGISYDQMDNLELKSTTERLNIQYPVMATAVSYTHLTLPTNREV